MNFKEIFQQTTPFLILCPLLILLMTYYLFAIWREGAPAIMLLPQVLVMLFVSIVFLFLDRMALKNWTQQSLVIAELVVLFLVYISVAYKNKTIEIHLTTKVTHFNIISPIEENKATELESIFPFNKKIHITKNNQIIFLSEKMKEAYTLKVVTQKTYVLSGETHRFADKTYGVDFYNFHYETDAGTIVELRRKAVLKKIEEVLKK